MAVRKIRIWPDPALSEVGKPVETFDDELKTLVADMFDTMYEASGVGLAATQIAVAKRVLVIDLDPHKDAAATPEVAAELKAWNFTEPREFINPEIVKGEGSIVWNEGCLSVPGFTEKVKRFERILIKAQDRNGDTFELDCNGLYAVALQHEMDHLNGKVFVEHLSRLKRDVAKRKMMKIKQETDDGVFAAANLI
jgi:peptide deformylase